MDYSQFDEVWLPVHGELKVYVSNTSLAAAVAENTGAASICGSSMVPSMSPTNCPDCDRADFRGSGRGQGANLP